MKDPILSGAVAGVAASVLSFAAELLLKATGLVDQITFVYIERLILPEGHLLPPLPLAAVVYSAAFTASAFFGTGLALLYRFAGPGFWGLKALWYGGLLLILHVSIIPKLWEPSITPLFTSSAVMEWELIGKFGWALLAGYLILRLPKS